MTAPGKKQRGGSSTSITCSSSSGGKKKRPSAECQSAPKLVSGKKSPAPAVPPAEATDQAPVKRPKPSRASSVAAAAATAAAAPVSSLPAPSSPPANPGSSSAGRKSSGKKRRSMSDAAAAAEAPVTAAGAALEAASVPVVVVTEAAQLPRNFLSPPGDGEDALVVGFDCEGVGLSREGRLCVMQFATVDDGGSATVYLVDVVQGGRALVEACRPALESATIVKVVHDCRRDGEALFFQFGVKLHGVFDTQVAHALIEGSEKDVDNISFVHLLADKRYIGAAYEEKQAIRQLLLEDPEFWVQRPWIEMMKRAAADDVRHLPLLYSRMMPLLQAVQLPLSPTSKQQKKVAAKKKQQGRADEQHRYPLLRTLAVRSSLRVRSFCCVQAGEFRVDDGAWPDLPTCPYALVAEGPLLKEEEREKADGQASLPGASAPAKEKAASPKSPASRSSGAGGGSKDDILVVVAVPPGRMGVVIGKKGASIRATREACPGAEVFTAGSKGPNDKVFVIGPQAEADKARAIISGRFQY